MRNPMTFLFAAAMFVNALLLFLVQPMFAKLLLPRFGGSPAVWTTCMLFFQSALLAGYAYSHSLVKLRQPWQQAAVHLVVMALPILTLPIAVANMSTDGEPVSSVLRMSAISVGAPFFALATSAPLLQRWFASANHRAPVDPYFLYAASNVGSFASLILYPTLIEPALALSTQTRVWSVGYSTAMLLTIACAIVMWRRAAGTTDAAATEADTGNVTWARRLRWIGLAFVPSSLMLAVTAYLTTDVAAVPLLWVIPLALYLITFVVTFSAYAERVVAVCSRFFPLILLYLIWQLTTETQLPLALMASTHLVGFLVMAMLCHGALADDRPATSHLTDFYLSLAVGGALGGLFNSLLAPLIFDSVVEYPLALACGIVLLTFHKGTQPLLRGRRWWLQPAAVAILTVIGLSVPGSGRQLVLITWGFLLAAVLVSFSVSRDRRRFAACVLMMLAVYAVVGGRVYPDVAYASRTFFGMYRVVSAANPPSYTLLHGTTIHGRQRVGSSEPLTYYFPGSVVAQIWDSRPAGTSNAVGVVGLGIGTLASYARPGERWIFYEIDAEVERIARDPRYFTYLATCRASCQVVIGDARLTLEQRSDIHDVIVLDAFSSDAIPIHLLTREAMEVYFSRLKPDGILAVHISNNHLDLRPVVANVMRDLGLAGRVQYQGLDPSTGKLSSQWAVLARSEDALGTLATDERWLALRPSSQRVWTDDFSNLWSVIQWRQPR